MASVAPILAALGGGLDDAAGRAALHAAALAFMHANADPKHSPNLQDGDAQDPVQGLLAALQHVNVREDADLTLSLLSVAKVLTRKQGNRVQLRVEDLQAVVGSMAPPLTPVIAAEGANVLLNACYEPSNVGALLRTSGVRQLVNFLLDDDQDVQANAAGAIQSICYQEAGRAAVCELEGMQSLLALLASPNAKVVSRAAGAVHNLSTDAGAIQVIRCYGGILLLADLLNNEDEQIAGSAAGALQNVSREVASRFIIKELDVVGPLAKLLSSQEVSVQLCASGALLNIMGPELEEQGGLASGARDRRALGRLMSTAMSASMVYHAIYSQRPALELS